MSKAASRVGPTPGPARPLISSRWRSHRRRGGGPAPDARAARDGGGAGGAAGAAEAAVHEIDDSGVGAGGSPVETEPSVAGDPSLDDPELTDTLADPEADLAYEDVRQDPEYGVVPSDGDTRGGDDITRGNPE